VNAWLIRLSALVVILDRWLVKNFRATSTFPRRSELAIAAAKGSAPFPPVQPMHSPDACASAEQLAGGCSAAGESVVVGLATADVANDADVNTAARTANAVFLAFISYLPWAEIRRRTGHRTFEARRSKEEPEEATTATTCNLEYRQTRTRRGEAAMSRQWCSPIFLCWSRVLVTAARSGIGSAELSRREASATVKVTQPYLQDSLQAIADSMLANSAAAPTRTGTGRSPA
jgi:hypothetical protein